MQRHADVDQIAIYSRDERHPPHVYDLETAVLREETSALRQAQADRQLLIRLEEMQRDMAKVLLSVVDNTQRPSPATSNPERRRRSRQVPTGRDGGPSRANGGKAYNTGYAEGYVVGVAERIEERPDASDTEQ